MKISNLISLLDSGAKPTVQFNRGEWDPDAGMKGEIVGYSIDDTEGDTVCYCIKIDMTKYLEFNKSIATNKFGDRGASNITWFQTSFYPKNNVFNFFVMSDLTSSDHGFDVLENSNTGLYDKFLNEKPGMSYIQWLENNVSKNVDKSLLENTQKLLEEINKKHPFMSIPEDEGLYMAYHNCKNSLDQVKNERD